MKWFKYKIKGDRSYRLNVYREKFNSKPLLYRMKIHTKVVLRAYYLAAIYYIKKFLNEKIL